MTFKTRPAHQTDVPWRTVPQIPCRTMGKNRKREKEKGEEKREEKVKIRLPMNYGKKKKMPKYMVTLLHLARDSP